MPVVFDKTEHAAIVAMAEELIHKYHPSFVMEDGKPITISIQTASQAKKENGESDDEPPLKDGLYPAWAKIKILGINDRVDGFADVRFIIDENIWSNLTESQRYAHIDSLLCRLEIKTKDGFVVTDDVGRPKLQIKRCDWRIEGNRVCAQRHGENAPEVIAAREFQDRYGDVAMPASKLFI